MLVLSTDFNMDSWKLDKLDELYKFVSLHSGVPIPRNYPIVGKHAFTHCAGVHTHAAAINPTHYESLNPEVLGKERTFSLDHMSGIASLNYALSLIKESDLTEELQLEVLAEVKNIGQKGKVVELSELPHIVHFIKQNYKHKQKSK
jgi:2-isopropylmalate synthase